MASFMGLPETFDLTDMASTSAIPGSQPTTEDIVRELHSRFRADEPYTRLSPTSLVVVNPLKTQADLSDASAEDYRRRTYADTQWEQQGSPPPESALPPHPYELASRVYHMLRRTKQSQAVVFNGSTGSGKSYISALFTQQLLRIAGSSTKKEHKVAEQIRSLDVLLRSFGAAKTRDNSDASRHSRYLELHFSPQGRLGAAKVLTFALEKSRVNWLQQDERTFHVFYQLLTGANHEERESMRLLDVTEYRLLSSSNCFRLPEGPSSDEGIAFQDLRVAMKVLGFKPKHCQAIFSTLSAILHLGNIEFTDSGGAEVADIVDVEPLADAAELLGIAAEDLAVCLAQKTRYVGQQSVSSLLDAAGCQAQRDGLMRDLYATLFAFVVETANHKLAPTFDDHLPLQIVQFDTPGGPAQSLTGSHQAFVDDFAAQCFSNWLTRRDLDSTCRHAKEQADDGLARPDVEWQDSSACVELLRGGVIGSAATDRKPAGILGVLDSASHRVCEGDMKVDDTTALANELDDFAAHTSYVSSRNPAGRSDAFGIRYAGETRFYQLSGLASADMDAFDPSTLQLLRKSEVSFIARLFAGPCVTTQTHFADANTITQASVSIRPLRQPTAAAGAQLIEPLLDAAKPYNYSRQVNATLSQLLGILDHMGQLWTVHCLRPNRGSVPGSFQEEVVYEQVRALQLSERIKISQQHYARNMTFEDFAQRFQPYVEPAALAVGVTDAKDKIQAFVIANAWRENKDFALGQSRIWLGYSVWRRMEDRLRSTEPSEPIPHPKQPASLAPSAMPEHPSSYPPSMRSGVQRAVSHGSRADLTYDEDDMLLRGRTASPGPFDKGGDSVSAFNVPPPGLAEPPHNGQWGTEWGKSAAAYGNASSFNLAEKADADPPRPLDADVEEAPTTAIRRWWVRFVNLFTCMIPNALLAKWGGMKRPDVQMAWREKFAICGLIFFACAFILFYILAFGRLLCPDSDKAWDTTELADHASDNDYYVAIAGNVYDLSKFVKLQHSDISSEEVTSDIMLELGGLDLTAYFPVPLTLGCPGLVTDDTFTLDVNSNLTATVTQAVHTSGALQTNTGTALDNDDWYTATLQPFLAQYWKGYFVWTKDYISNNASWRDWAVIDGKLYDLTNYFETTETETSSTTTAGQAYAFFDSTISDLFEAQAGADITSDFKKVMDAFNTTYQEEVMTCLDNVFYIGRTDFRETPRCLVQNYLLLAFSLLLVVTILAKFLAALQLTTKRMPEQQDKFVICQIPCYTEGETELRKTIDSIAASKYDDKRKLIFVICDGMIIGNGNDAPTPRIVLDILGVNPKLDPEPLMFKSIAEGSKQLNYGKVYSGLYEFEGHIVPYIVVVKVGRPSERTKPGNRGKRDTQILLMRYLNRVHFDAPMFPMELEIYHQMRNVIGIDPAFYEFVLMIDADTSVDPDGINRLVSVAADDGKIIALCGETSLDNPEDSWWTMIQVYEYYISHHLSKAFESLFGTVTCLPGCFSMYRIRSADKGRPLFVSTKLIEQYSDNVVDTLHKKNLLALGEDRYLTTLILKNFPSFRTKFIADAKAHTAAPESFSVLLSQRRRWINSTIHNLAELLLTPQLCGFCLFSMRFIVFIDLIGTILLPATVIYLLYLIIVVSTGKAAVPIISLALIAAVYGLQAVIFLLKRQWQYIGWLVVYILAYPIYSFFLPVYSFWHMDDFSWGNTRIVVGEKGNKKIIAGTDDEPYDDSMIPLKRFSEYQRDVLGHSDARSMKGARSGAGSVYSGREPMESLHDWSPYGEGNPFGSGSRPGSLFKSQSYANSIADSIHSGSPAGGGDYYQSTNILEKNAPLHSRSSSYALGNGGLRSPSRASLLGGGENMSPSQSRTSMWNMGAPMYPTAASMYGMPTTPHASMYSLGGQFGGMPQGFASTPPHMLPSYGSGLDGYGVPSPGRGPSMMSMGPQMTGGSFSTMGNPFAGNSGMPSARSPSISGIGGMNGAKGGSGGSDAAAAGGVVLAPNPSTDPTDAELSQAIVTYLGQQSDLYSVTTRNVREAVEASFANADLRSRKAQLNRLIDGVLQGQV